VSGANPAAMHVSAAPRASAVDRLSSEGAFDVLARARVLEAQGRSILHFEVGEPDFETPAHIRDAGIAAIEAGHTHYAPSAGILPLRETIAAYAARFRGIAPYDPAHVVVSPGLKPLVWNTLCALLDPGDELIYADPAYPAYAACASYLQATAIPVPLLEASDFRLDLDRLAAAMTPRTRVIILNSPANPTGGLLPREDLERIAELAIRHDAIVLSDEIYSRNLYDDAFASIASVPGMRDRTIVLDGFSKAYAMTGWRLGYGIMPAAIARDVILFSNNTYSCVAPFVQYAGIAALEGPDDAVLGFNAQFRERRDAIVAGLNALPGVTCRLPRGAFYAFPNVSQITLDDKKLAAFLLDEADVAVPGGSCFGPYGRGYLRFSYASSLAKIDAALARIGEALPRFRG